jgi:hypothetical protein
MTQLENIRIESQQIKLGKTIIKMAKKCKKIGVFGAVPIVTICFSLNQCFGDKASMILF